MTTTLREIDINSTIRSIEERKLSKQKMSSNAFDSDDDDYEDYDTAVGKKPVKGKGKNKVFLENEDESEGKQGYLSPLVRNTKKTRPKSSICFDDSEEEEYQSEGYMSPLARSRRNNDKQSVFLSPVLMADGKRKQHAPDVNPSSLVKATPNPQARKRRRSSARFLRLSGRFECDDDLNENFQPNDNESSQQNLGEMYRQVIRLNAENKINAGNTWGLKLIDNIDKFLGDEDDAVNNKIEYDADGNAVLDVEKKSNNTEKRVNFTKASCTLDASVKIYSFRVDDVHLTSYKVLANLNRTDGGSPVIDESPIVHSDDVEEHVEVRRERTHTVKSTNTVTLESNLANLNITKLEAAYDIDPIFNKMSQKFDEGGAKGLLLVNLCVANDSNRIVLDSKEDDSTDAAMDINQNIPNDSSYNTPFGSLSEDEPQRNDQIHSWNGEGLIDISSLSIKLKEAFFQSPLESIPLVPQLADLRATYEKLESEGFSDGKIIEFKSNRYANSEAEEKEAERVIHREATERSRFSGERSFSMYMSSSMTPVSNLMSIDSHAMNDNDSHEYGPDDYGCDDDDYDEGDFNTFVNMDDPPDQYSSQSFIDGHKPDLQAKAVDKMPTSTFLDAVCECDTLDQGGEYKFFNEETLKKLTSGNQWAGSAHWKMNESIRRKPANLNVTITESTVEAKPDKKSKKKSVKAKSMIEIKTSKFDCLESLLKKDQKKGRGKKTNEPVSTLSKIMKKKYSQDKNILPADAGISVEKLSTMFSRPKDTSILETSRQTNEVSKNVGFNGVVNFGGDVYDDGVDDSFGNDCDDGPGFQLADDNNVPTYSEDDEGIVQNLADVRKVEKVHVTHATVAKKVDVKRLKKDLWTEISEKTEYDESLLESTLKSTFGNTVKNFSEDAEDSVMESSRPMTGESTIDLLMDKKTVSFKETVDKLGETQAQDDVSLAFYFICILHLANEKSLKLDNADYGLSDFIISQDIDVMNMTLQ